MRVKMSDIIYWTILVFLIAAALTGCVEPPLRDQVRETCGVPAKDLSNIDAYTLCVTTVLDIHSEQNAYAHTEQEYEE